MSELPKYQIIESSSLFEVNTEIGEAVEQGYKLHTFTALELEEERGRGPQYIAVMSLSSSTNYDSIERLVDVSPAEVNDYLDKGYIVADSWAKNIRMVKKK